MGELQKENTGCKLVITIGGKEYGPGEDLPLDFDGAPQMVAIPPGSFMMGSPSFGGINQEKPQHEVSLDYWLAVGKYPVTFEEWDRYAMEVAGAHKPDDNGWGRGRRPVINVNWCDADGYCKWLSQKTGQRYRLLSEAEWEYACRAGTTSQFYWGESDALAYIRDYAVCDGISDGKTAEVGSKLPNAWGLFDMSGNVCEWLEDSYHDNYDGAPTDGSAWTGRDVRHVIRGGSWNYHSELTRAAERGMHMPAARSDYLGLRVARMLVNGNSHKRKEVIMISPEELRAILRTRIYEFGEKPAYILYLEEYLAGMEYGIFTSQEAPQDPGDGTILMYVIFEGATFVFVTTKDEHLARMGKT